MSEHGHEHHRHDRRHAAPEGAGPGRSAVAARAKYTCPMHPEVLRDGPGSCPICGMALVPIAGTGEADDSELKDLTRRFQVGTILTIPLGPR